MSSLEAQEFIEKCSKQASLLGLDVGSKTIGLSVVNLTIGVATPLQTVERKKFKADSLVIEAAIQEYNIDGLVVGYPYEMNGAEGRRCQSIRDFMSELQNHIKCPPYTFYDERLSTAAVDSYWDGFVDNSINKRKAKQKGLTDKLAAQVILQGFVDQYY